MTLLLDAVCLSHVFVKGRLVQHVKKSCLCCDLRSHLSIVYIFRHLQFEWFMLNLPLQFSFMCSSLPPDWVVRSHDTQTEEVFANEAEVGS